MSIKNFMVGAVLGGGRGGPSTFFFSGGGAVALPCPPVEPPPPALALNACRKIDTLITALKTEEPICTQNKINFNDKTG